MVQVHFSSSSAAHEQVPQPQGRKRKSQPGMSSCERAYPLNIHLPEFFVRCQASWGISSSSRYSTSMSAHPPAATLLTHIDEHTITKSFQTAAILTDIGSQHAIFGSDLLAAVNIACIMSHTPTYSLYTWSCTACIAAQTTAALSQSIALCFKMHACVLTAEDLGRIHPALQFVASRAAHA